MKFIRPALGVVLGGGALSLSVVACGELTAEVGPPPTLFAATDAAVLLDVPVQPPPLTCPVSPPEVPMYLADGGVFEPYLSEAGAIPVMPDVCTFTGACEWGTSPDRHCNGVYTCDGANWSAARNTSCHADVCPSTKEAIGALQGRPCTIPNAGASEEAMCDVADGLCVCTTGAGGSDVHERRWECSAPLLRACPLERPRIGAPCSAALYCDYGACRTKRGLAMQCIDGAWRVATATCAP